MNSPKLEPSEPITMARNRWLLLFERRIDPAKIEVVVDKEIKRTETNVE